jgi:hypothetical protein
MTSSISLNGSASYDPDGDPITYSWRIVGNGQATILNADSATPSVILGLGYGSYAFELTVRDDKGATSSDTVRINYIDP